jgi:hypothetical protein
MEFLYRFTLFCLLLVLSVGSALPSFSHPITYSGGTAIEFSYSPTWTRFDANYTFDRKFSAGLQLYRFSDDEQSFLGQLNGLLYRHNSEDAQTNIIARAFGGTHGNATSMGAAYGGGLDLNYENQKYYLGASGIYLKTDASPTSPSRSEIRFRAGLSPYQGDYQEIQTWAFLQVERRSWAPSPWMVGPVLRLFYRAVLVEFSVNQQGMAEAMAMIHF